MSDKSDRDPFAGRYDTSERDESDKSENSSKNSKTSKSNEPSNSSQPSKTENRSNESEDSKTSKSTEDAEESETVRGRTNVNMYLPDSVVEDLRLTYAELNVRYQREKGEELPKNKTFYPAVIRAAQTNNSIEDILFNDN